MTILRAGLAFVMMTLVGTANGNAQIVESSPHQLGNTSRLRIAPPTGQGPVQNVIDLLNLRRADAIVPSDVLAYLRGGRLPGADASIAYIKRLDQEEVHILARQNITSI